MSLSFPLGQLSHPYLQVIPSGINHRLIMDLAAFMSPPSDPFMAVLEREILIISLVSVSWA